MENTNLFNPSVLSFVGDAVYSLCVRTYLSDQNRPSGTLHNMAVEYVKATSQAAAFKKIEPHLTEDELSVFKRGRNFHTSNTPKASTIADYHIATGLECIFGYLHLSGQKDRIEELFRIIISQKNIGWE